MPVFSSLNKYVWNQTRSLFCTDGDYIVEFAIWERGDIGLKILSESLKNAVRHALCEILIEFYLLPSSLSVVPSHLLASNNPDTRRRSSSDPGKSDIISGICTLYSFLCTVFTI